MGLIQLFVFYCHKKLGLWQVLCANHTPARQFINFIWIFKIWIYLWVSLNYLLSIAIKIRFIANLMVQTPLRHDYLLKFYEHLKSEFTYGSHWTICFLLPNKIGLWQMSYGANQTPAGQCVNCLWIFKIWTYFWVFWNYLFSIATKNPILTSIIHTPMWHFFSMIL